MMWNWLITGLSSGINIVLFDGSPVQPNISVLWSLLEKFKITHFGTSPKYLSLLKQKRYSPKNSIDLKSLRMILSTGAPLLENHYYWVYKNVKKNLMLCSISGGTDIISCFVLGNPILPIYPGENQCKGLGMNVDCFDESGNSLVDEKGELVCKSPFPSMPIYFWNDKDSKRYQDAYFRKYEGVWTHGDFIQITERNTIIIYGRSDTVLNPGGVRIGTAEIYRQLHEIEEISNSIVVGLPKNGDVEIVLFVVLNNESKLEPNLSKKIKVAIRTGASPRHVPKEIFQVQDLPRTISGKNVEKAVLKVLRGEDTKDFKSIANPESLSEIERISKSLM